ncbi:MAG: two-component system, OmpR family, alkaline phosphatase synthesis response regulator PhoP [Eubacteriales bacterium]|nr:two-component system, OmpR family, alkaline phosphatase synthesis response regulator PhoP [Eubacteriales bacterium]MDN5364129.1 two-component system, OmpR family, alkaline phosphatase synthesis response regulator PhoP [Eubacteriales bacterium]
MAAKILVVDDEPNIVELVRFNLEREGYEVIAAGRGSEGLKAAREKKPDLIILDIMLPEIDGYEICRLLQQDAETSHIPIIMLTARGEEVDRVLGLELGADDYITKPFSPRELVARVKARLRRQRREENKEGKETIRCGAILIDLQRFQAFCGERRLELTPKEFELLRVLAGQPGKVFTREHLLEKVWGYDYTGDTRTVDVHIRHLRQKLAEAGAEDCIETVRGVGYRMKEHGEEKNGH